jgi:hypothetical protein
MLATAQPLAVQSCGSATPQLRTTLYFGGSRPKGSVSELEWQLFLRDEVTPRFPNGMTVWDAEGQWRAPGGEIGHERTKVLLLVHPDTEGARQAIRAVIERYPKYLNRNRCSGKRRGCAPRCDLCLQFCSRIARRR